MNPEAGETAALWKKLRLAPGQRALILHCPAALQDQFTTAAPDTTPADPRGGYDFILLFLRSQAELAEAPSLLAGLGKPDCLLWAAYPKKSGTIPSDLHRDLFWTAFASLHLRPVTQIALDADWSALRFRPLPAAES